jgi:hypothetical protein
MDQLFINSRRSKPAPVVQEFLSMVGGESEDAVLPLPKGGQRLYQTRNLRVNPPDTGVVKPHDLFANSPEAVCL